MMKSLDLWSSLLFCSCLAIPIATPTLADPEHTNEYTQTVTRDVLGAGLPADAPNKILELVRYEIPPFMALPVHTHPGMQTAQVEFGVLTYSVVEGTALIQRADGSQESLNAGETTLLRAGDAVTEPGGMVHFGANETPNVVILISASLFLEDQPKATLVETE